jgi:hypothetical protein
MLTILLDDGSAFPLAATLHRAYIPLVFFADFDASRGTVRAEVPNTSGACQEARLPDLLGALEAGSSH